MMNKRMNSKMMMLLTCKHNSFYNVVTVINAQFTLAL